MHQRWPVLRAGSWRVPQRWHLRRRRGNTQRHVLLADCSLIFLHFAVILSRNDCLSHPARPAQISASETPCSPCFPKTSLGLDARAHVRFRRVDFEILGRENTVGASIWNGLESKACVIIPDMHTWRHQCWRDVSCDSHHPLTSGLSHHVHTAPLRGLVWVLGMPLGHGDLLDFGKRKSRLRRCVSTLWQLTRVNTGKYWQILAKYWLLFDLDASEISKVWDHIGEFGESEHSRKTVAIRLSDSLRARPDLREDWPEDHSSQTLCPLMSRKSATTVLAITLVATRIVVTLFWRSLLWMPRSWSRKDASCGIFWLLCGLFGGTQLLRDPWRYHVLEPFVEALDHLNHSIFNAFWILKPTFNNF
jgi:hypothetical protein